MRYGYNDTIVLRCFAYAYYQKMEHGRAHQPHARKEIFDTAVALPFGPFTDHQVIDSGGAYELQGWDEKDKGEPAPADTEADQAAKKLFEASKTSTGFRPMSALPTASMSKGRGR